MCFRLFPFTAAQSQTEGEASGTMEIVTTQGSNFDWGEKAPLGSADHREETIKKDTVATRHRHSHALAGGEEPQSAGTKGKEKHTPLVPNSLCVWPEQPLPIIL